MADTDFVQYGEKSFSGPPSEMAAQGARVHTDLAGKPFQCQSVAEMFRQVMPYLVQGCPVFPGNAISDRQRRDYRRFSCMAKSVEDGKQPLDPDDAFGTVEFFHPSADVACQRRIAVTDATGAFFQQGGNDGILGNAGHVFGKEIRGKIQDFTGTPFPGFPAGHGIAQMQMGNVAADQGHVSCPVVRHGLTDVFPAGA